MTKFLLFILAVRVDVVDVHRVDVQVLNCLEARKVRVRFLFEIITFILFKITLEKLGIQLLSPQLLVK